MAEGDLEREVSEPGGAYDMRAAELTSLAVFHREEWTPGLGGEGCTPAAPGAVGALICSVSMELSQAASYLALWEGDISPQDVGGLPIDAMPDRIALLFARAAAACVCAVAEIQPEMIEQHPNRMDRREVILDALDDRVFGIVEEGDAAPWDVDDEAGDPNAWLRGALTLLGVTASHLAYIYGLSPLPAGAVHDIHPPDRRQRAFLLMRRRIDIAESLNNLALLCALGAAWFERNAEQLELRGENLIDFGD